MPEETNPQREARPTILLVEDDDDARPSLTADLRRQGYGLLVAADLEDAREWVGGDHIHADLVLVNLVRKTPRMHPTRNKVECLP